MDHRNLEYKFKKEIFLVLKKNYDYLMPENKFNLELSSDIEDSKYSYDMRFKKEAQEIQISVRIRKKYALQWRHFTVRSKAKFNGKTEITKLIEGYGQYYFYGWMDEQETKIEEYLLIDINKIRNYLEGNGDHLKNGDGTEFLAYSIQFLNDFDSIIDSNTKLPSRPTHYDFPSVFSRIGK